MSRFFTLILIVSFASHAYGQHVHDHDRVIRFPDVAGYHTLLCDLHMHTVFSDGSVWPNIRVQEAIRDGLDAISVTDHIEYQPHRDDIPHPDRNRSHEIADAEATGSELIVIRGSEITRDMPPGHANAIFVEDVNALMIDDPVAVFREANRQGAFVFWNHPNWTAQRDDGVATLTEMHRMLISEGLLHGIEVVNEDTYSEEALRIALENDLAILGTSDIHGLIDWQFDVPAGGHRPVTLVFAADRTADGIEAALRAGRTVVWHHDTVIGREDNVRLLLDASIHVVAAQYDGDTSVLRLQVRNSSGAGFILQNQTDYTFHRLADVFTLPAQSTREIQLKTVERLDSVTVAFE
ncbi:MAG: Sb-PDE family phosphodiesterase, partial [Rhodothermales bacterium]|nr:Sb-PDE family phosphodiesterase [Rhodothermales bacterium]